MNCTHENCRQGRDCDDATAATRALYVRARAIAARARTWAMRVLVSWLMLTGWMPRGCVLVYLEWLRECLSPQHPAMDLVLVEIATVRDGGN